MVMRSTQKHKSEMSLKGSPSKEIKMHSSKRSSQKHLISLNKQLLDLNHEGESRLQPMLHNPSESRTSQSVLASNRSKTVFKQGLAHNHKRPGSQIGMGMKSMLAGMKKGKLYERP